MESNDSQDNIAGEGWIEFMLIFSVVLIVIGLVLDHTMASSDRGYLVPSPVELILSLIHI